MDYETFEDVTECVMRRSKQSHEMKLGFAMFHAEDDAVSYLEKFPCGSLMRLHAVWSGRWRSGGKRNRVR